MTARTLDYKCPHCLEDNLIERHRIKTLGMEQIVVCKSCRQPLELTAVEGLNNTLNLIASAEHGLIWDHNS